MPDPTQPPNAIELIKKIAERSRSFDPFMIVLGRVATTWAEYESTINIRIWELANVAKMAGACITSQMIGPGPRFKCLLALLELREAPAEIIKAFNSHSVQAQKIGRQRNRFLHDPLLIDTDSGQIQRLEMTADKHVRLQMIAIEIGELQSLLSKINQIIIDLDHLWMRVEAELPAWPREQFEQSPGIHLHRTSPGSGT